MKKLLSRSMVMAFLCFAGPQLAAAQQNGGGFGGFMDWIHRLSGPRMLGGSVSYFSPHLPAGSPENGARPILRGRLTAAYRHSVSSDDKIEPDGSPITMFSIRPMVEISLHEYVEIGIGGALHRFGGDADSFWHWSIPAYLQAGVPLTDVVELKAGVGVHYWPKFDAGDFLPLVVDVRRDEGEFTPAAFLGFDFHVFDN